MSQEALKKIFSADPRNIVMHTAFSRSEKDRIDRYCGKRRMHSSVIRLAVAEFLDRNENEPEEGP